MYFDLVGATCGRPRAFTERPYGCGGSNLSTDLFLWGICIKKCISPVRICLQTRNGQNASTKFRKTLETKPSKRSHSVCAKRNFIGRKPTSLQSTSFARSATSFICAASGNDVLASLEMMLPLRANDVVPAAQMKNPKAELSDFWLG